MLKGDSLRISEPPKRFMVVGDTIGLPNGYASTSRMVNLAVILRDSGAKVEILLVKPSDYSGTVTNFHPRGEVHGIPFRYMPGCTTFSTNTFGRRFQSIKGLLTTCCRILLAGSDKVVVLAYTRNIEVLFFLRLACWIKGYSVVLELCEWPTTWPVTNFFRKLHYKLYCKYCLALSDGVIVISSPIEGIVREYNLVRNEQLPMIKIPILSEDTVRVPASVPNVEHVGGYLLFCGNLQYRDTVQCVIKAFAAIAISYPSLRLVIAGSTKDKSCLEYFLRLAEQLNIQDKISFTGFVEREVLLRLYTDAVALLIPLFDDSVSKARFPTKLAEYLLSGRPVVTTAFGEVDAYLEDGVNAFIAEDDSSATFARKIGDVLADSDAALQIGTNGRKVALANFTCTAHTERVKEWLERL